MKRTIHRAQCLEGREADTLAQLPELTPALQRRIADEALLTLSLFRWQRNLFLYCEHIREEISPAELFGPLEPLLEPWPCEEAKRRWVPMMEVFHFNRPASVEHWRRKEPPGKRLGKVGRIWPDKVASYIYYHYQLQEEQAFPGGKYQFIGLYENMLFLYDELPQVREPLVHEKGLKTTGTPANWEDSRMDLHFIPWPDGIRFNREIELVLGL